MPDRRPPVLVPVEPGAGGAAAPPQSGRCRAIALTKRDRWHRGVLRTHGWSTPPISPLWRNRVASCAWLGHPCPLLKQSGWCICTGPPGRFSPGPRESPSHSGTFAVSRRACIPSRGLAERRSPLLLGRAGVVLLGLVRAGHALPERRVPLTDPGRMVKRDTPRQRRCW